MLTKPLFHHILFAGWGFLEKAEARNSFVRVEAGIVNRGSLTVDREKIRSLFAKGFISKTMLSLRGGLRETETDEAISVFFYAEVLTSSER